MELNPSSQPFMPSTSIKATSHKIISKDNCSNSCWFPIVKIKVCGFSAVALIDSCSTNSYVKTSFTNKIGLSGRKGSCNINTLSGTSSNDGMIYDISVIGSGDQPQCISAYCIHDIPVPSPGFDANMYDHLKDLQFDQVHGKSVDLLLGTDVGDLNKPLELRCGSKPHQPYAVRTAIGWYVCGISGHLNDRSSDYEVNLFARVNSSSMDRVAITHTTAQLPTLEDFKLLWNHDQDVGPDDDLALSSDDTYVLNLWSKNIAVVDGYIQLPIPLIPEVTYFPSSESRLNADSDP